ncbi:MAG TPA: tail fiber domain-containing protein [Ensifer sp.]|nr:tail fiber domain-containing protein [Ensifer sp.]
MVSTPSAPDPKETASAQTATNVNTAIANAALGNVNQVTPDGSLTYNKTGSTTMTDQEGNTYQLPTYTATQTLSDANQKIYDTNQVTKQNLADIGQSESAKIGTLLGTNIDLSADNVNKYSNTNWQPGFDRQWNNQQTQLEQKLANQGVTPGSQAYVNAMSDFNTQRQQQEDTFLNDMYNTSMGAITQERNQPLNEISALMSGSQISQPNYVSTNSTQLPTVDYSSLVNQKYQSDLNSANATNSGLFGLGSALLGGWAMSDRRLKRFIEKVGQLASGISLYRYSLLGGPREVGVMADEVAQIMPDAVRIGPDGYARVNYAMVMEAA